LANLFPLMILRSSTSRLRHDRIFAKNEGAQMNLFLNPFSQLTPKPLPPIIHLVKGQSHLVFVFARMIVFGANETPAGDRLEETP